MHCTMVPSCGPPHLTKHINMIEKTQWSFSRYIYGMQGLSYPERLTVLKLYSLQLRRERYIIIYVWKILYQVPNFSPPIRFRTCITSHVGGGRLGTLAYNSFRWRAIRMFNQLPLFLRNTTVLFIVSRRNLIYIFLQCLIFHASRDHGDCLRWRTPCDGLADNYMQPNNPK